MKKIIVALLIAGIAGFLGYQTTLYYLPNVIYSTFKSRSTDTFGNLPNQTRVLMAPDETSRAVVKPNPDFAYVSTFYDVSDGPIQIKGLLPDSVYWSVAFYKPNTINYYVKNDLQFGSSELNLTLGQKEPQTYSNEFVRAESAEGFMLIRVLVTDKSAKNIRLIQKQLSSIQIKSL